MLILLLWLVFVVLGIWSGWVHYQWEGRLVASGRLPERRWLRRGARMLRWPWESWQEKAGLDKADTDAEIEALRRRVLLSSKLTNVAFVVVVLAWGYTAVR